MIVHCEVEMLSAWLDGELTVAEADRVAAHVETCAECRDELAAMLRVMDELRSLERVAPPPALAAEVSRRVKLEGRPLRLRALLAEHAGGVLQPGLGFFYAVVVSLAAIAGLVVLAPALERWQAGATAPLAVTAAALSPVGQTQLAAGRELLWDGATWREAAVREMPTVQVRIGTAEWERVRASEPVLDDLWALWAPVEVRRGDEVVRILPAI
jgi:anti-sigma factor RsiW